MRIPLEPPRGTRDILPPDSEYYQQLILRFSEIAELYGYRLAMVPTIEHFEIYEAKSGPGISKSMYIFQDKAGRMLCLRPEFTATIIRTYLKHLTAKPKPIKLYYYGQVFRYDEPQFGRYREFYQIGVEYIGEPGIIADIELFQLIRDFYRSIGLENYSFRINDISIVRGLLRRWGIPEETQDEILHLIDKGEVSQAMAVARSYAASETSLLEELLGIEVENPEDLEREVGKLGLPPEIVETGLTRLAELFKALTRLGLRVYVDLKLVRGLAYYTGTIFEVKVPGLNLSIGGGGRYDTLSQILGGASIPATGFSLGIERTVLALEAEKSLENLVKPRRKLMLVSLVGDVLYVDDVASKIRNRDIVVDVRYVERRRLSTLVGQAAKLGYDYVAIVGESELNNKAVTVKHLLTGKQATVSIDSINDLIA